MSSDGHRVRRSTILDCSGVGAGGITRVLTELVRHWPEGHRLQIVAAPDGWQPPAPRAAEVDVLSQQGGGRFQTIASATVALRRATAGQPADREEPARVLSLSPSVAIRGSRLPVTTIVHDLAFRLWPQDLPASVRQYRRISYSTAIRRSHRLLCVSARTQHDLLGLYGVPTDAAQVWHPGSDLAAGPGTPPAAVAGIRGRGGKYLVVAGHAPHKGVELAVEAMAALPGYVLVVLTGGQRVERFETAVARSAAAERVVFLDRITDAEYADTVAGAAAFLMPSHFEGYGLPAAEALALGTRAVISPDPALHEATAGAAIRMASWTSAALVQALRGIDQAPMPATGAGRSWAEATGHLVALLAEEPPVRQQPAEPGRRRM